MVLGGWGADPEKQGAGLQVPPTRGFITET